MSIFARFSWSSRLPSKKTLFVSLLLWSLLVPPAIAMVSTGSVLYDAFTGSDDAEQQKKTASNPGPKWQVGTITAVQPYKVPDADPSIISYKVSLRVGSTLYVVVNTPRHGSDIGIYARGRLVPVLVGEHTITYNDLLGNPFQVPILSRTTVTPEDSR